MGDMSATGLHLLPPAPDVCQACATKHDSAEPHNQQSLYYQYWFYGQHGRWPTWADALAHCDAEMRAAWTAGLAEHGVIVGEGGVIA